MNVREVIQTAIDDADAGRLWPCGLQEDASARAKKVWNLLPEVDRFIISMHNPFKGAREDAISELWQSGLSAAVISEMSGVSKAQVARIVRNETKRRKRKSAPTAKGTA